MELTVKDIQTWLDNYSKVIEEKDYLSELDTPIGDGITVTTWLVVWLNTKLRLTKSTNNNHGDI